MEFRKTSLGIILRDLGSTLLLLPISFIVPIVIAIIYKEFDLTIIFLIPAIIVFIVGYAFKRFFYSEEPARLRHAMAVSALLYFFAMLFGAIPLAFWQMSYMDACFEAMSGWSTTGLTMMLKPELAPRSILFYRSFIQWVGGAGIIVLMLTILSRPGLTTFALYRAEAREERIRPSIFGTARTIWWIYLIFTGLSILLFWMAGMSIFDSINHAMTGIATAGFSTHGASIGAYNNQLVEIVAIIIMCLGAINFGVHYRAITRSPSEYLHDPETISLLVIILGFIPLIFFGTFKIFGNISETFRHSLFQAFSCLTTTGFQSTDLKNWGDFSKVVMGTLMVIGASTGSTCGGIKLMRVIVLAIVTRWQVTRIL
ncbi:MAG: TrkH family potassium uptake protein, partial [Euryarchaeota archaeon]|nr:TrkH family potassium uptake protein [Euryarchaeota archaeon]